MTQISHVKGIRVSFSPCSCSVYKLRYFVRYFVYMLFWCFSYHDSVQVQVTLFAKKLICEKVAVLRTPNVHETALIFG